jgi:hypothetical protein
MNNNRENEMKKIWIAIIALVTAGFAAQATPVAAEWNFDTVQPAEQTPPPQKPRRGRTPWVFTDKASGMLPGEARDTVYGYIEQVEGVSGKALKFDGFTTKVVRKADHATPLGQHFTLEAWVAPQEFSLNQTAIISCEKDRQTGYFFGINDQGHLLVQANMGGKWQACRSSEPLPLHCWAHVAAIVDSGNGLTLYMNGKPVGSKPVKGPFTPAKGVDTWIGMSQGKQMPLPRKSTDPEMFSWMVFDGLIDELKIHTKVLSANEIQASYEALKPSEVRVLQYRKMPSGPKDGKRFGAFYTRLNYSPEWEKQWRVGDHADVVVTFEDPGANFVFWRGTSYIPHWVTQNDIWYNNQFVERRSNSDGCIGCVEPMSDKKCRFSHVRVLHSSPARTVIHWRYAPVGLKHKHPYVDPYSGLGDWVDEYYTIYPDKVGVRSMTLHSTAVNEFTDWQEAIIVHPPGRMPEDNIKATALSIGNLKGEVTDYTWPETSKGRKLKNLPAESCVQVVNLKSDLSPFMIVPPTKDITIKLFGGNGPKSMFRHWNHWPVAHGKSSTTNASDDSKPSHTSLTMWKDWPPYRSTHNSRTQLMLHGMTDKGCKDLTGLGQSWVSPAKASIVSGNYRSAGFDMEQKAYVVERQDSDPADALHLKLDAHPEAPLVNPAIVVRNWPEGADATVEVAGRKISPAAVRIGIEEELNGNNLVVFLKLESSGTTEIKIK